MSTSPHIPAGFEALVERLQPGARLLTARPLEGGVSAETTLLEMARPDGGVEKLVVRRHGPRDLAANPDVARDEYRLLTVLHAAGLPVPAPHYVDEAGTLMGSPLIVIDFVDGTDTIDEAELDKGLRQMAAFLADLHRLDGSDPALAFLSDPRDQVAAALANPPDQLDDSLSEGLIRNALTSAWPPKAQHPRSVLHGDYWPGNILWRRGHLEAVIDWEDAAAGDPLADLANARLELLWWFGREAMETFTALYRQNTETDLANLPLWDLYAALRPCSKLGTWGLDTDELQAMQEQHALFVQQALSALR